MSILLGHQSVRITEKHYAPWVRSRQEQLEADLTNAWKNDPVISTSNEVHGRDTTNGLPVTSSFHSAVRSDHPFTKRSGDMVYTSVLD